MEASVVHVRVSMWHQGQRYNFDVRPHSIKESIAEFESTLKVLRGLAAGLDSEEDDGN